MKVTINSDRVFINHDQAMRELLESQGTFFQRPNVPSNWNIRVLKEDLGLLYFNPEDKYEFIKVMPPRLEYTDRIFHEFYVVYHTSSKLIDKEYKNKQKFEWENKQHTGILDDILTKLNTDYPESLPDGEKKSKKTILAGKELEGFWFNLDDLQFVREYLGFNKIPQNIVNHIQRITCDCHELALSNSGGGILYQHKEHHYYNTRIAHHPTPGAQPFIKVGGDRGYFTSTGNLSTASATATHLLIHEVLGNPFDWYRTPCKKVYGLRRFDYEKAKASMISYFVEEQKKRHRYV
ncbi:MAG: hypothetical protein LW832_01155 [Parachlamydia sp.]|nr:hypothetical protein [Parachlamydia sp.]